MDDPECDVRHAPQELGVRPFEERDWPAIWSILEPIFRAGETYAVPRDVSEVDAKRKWTAPPAGAFVAELAATGEIVGTYYIRANYDGPGAHVANCGYAVPSGASGPFR